MLVGSKNFPLQFGVETREEETTRWTHDDKDQVGEKSISDRQSPEGSECHRDHEVTSSNLDTSCRLSGYKKCTYTDWLLHKFH